MPGRPVDSGPGVPCDVSVGWRGVAALPGDHGADVSRHRVQLDAHAKPVQSRHAGGSGTGGPPVLAARRDPLLTRPATLPLQHVHTNLRPQLQQTAPTLQVAQFT